MSAKFINHRQLYLSMSGVHPSSCYDLKDFLMKFIFITAESVQATQGGRAIKVMSVDMGSRLWNEMRKEFTECSSPKMQISERIECFMESLRRTMIIEDFSIACLDGHLKITIKNCFFVQASSRQRREGMEYPLCPIGGLIVAGLHENAGLLTTLEKIEHDPVSGISTLTLDMHPPRSI
jgi:hypothetical protein